MDNKKVEKNNSIEEKRKVIPLHKTYLWGIVLCIVAMIAIVLINILNNPRPPANVDYLALLRDNHNTCVSQKRLIRKGDKTIGDLEDLLRKKSDRTVLFPDWLGKDPTLEIIGVRTSKIGEDEAVNLVFKSDGKLINFLTLYSNRAEIDELAEIKIEDHSFRVYTWRKNRALFWELMEDNLSITYALISDMDSDQLEQMALETMLSLKAHYERKK